MNNTKKVLYNGSILKLGNTNNNDNKINNNNQSNFDYKIEKRKWKNGSNAVFHYRTWMISFSPNSLTSSKPVSIPFEYMESRCMRCNYNGKLSCHHSKQNKNEKCGWRKKGNKYVFDEDVLNYFKNHYSELNEKNNRVDENNTDNNDKKNKFTVTPVGDTHSINNEKPFELRLGRKFSALAFEECIQTMNKGEKSLFLCAPDTIVGYNKMEIILQHIDYKTHLLCNKAGFSNQNDMDMAQHLINYKNKLYEKYHALTQSNIVLLLEIELLDIQKPETFKKSIWEMNDEEKYNHVISLKEEGNHLFKTNELSQASVKFQEALSILQIMIHSGSLLNENFNRQCSVKSQKEEKKSSKNIEKNTKDYASLDNLISLSNICRLNYSACQLKLNNYQSVIENCTEVLKNDPENIKAYFRRGKAYSMIDSNLDLAKKDFYKLREIYNKYQDDEEGKLNSALLPSSDKMQLNYKNEIKILNTEIKLLENRIKQQNSQQKSFFARLFSYS